MSNNDTIIESSGNVFADLGMPDAAAGTMAWPVVKLADVARPGLPRNGNHCSPNAML